MLLAVKFSEFITRWNVVLGILLCSLGLALIFLARRVTQTIEKTDTVSKASKVYIVTKIAGVVVLLAGMILIAIPR